MPTQSDLKFQLGRVAGLFRTILRNRRATLGLILLLTFSFIALAAPIISPGNPNASVSGSLAQPEWTLNFPDGYYLSRNIQAVTDPSFTSSASVQAWTVSSTAVVSNTALSYSPQLKFAGSQGSLQLSYSGKSPAEVNVTHSFQFPYHGPPSDFQFQVSMLAFGASNSTPIGLRLFIAEGSRVFTLSSLNQTVSGSWLNTKDSSESNSVRATLGFGQNSFKTAGIIFSAVDTYSFGVGFSFSGPGQVNVGTADLFLRGTAFGLLGTDNSGRDLFAQNVYGSQISLYVGLTAAAIGISLGLFIGLLAGFLGRVVDEVLMRFTDMMLVIPALPLLIVLLGVVGRNLTNVIAIIGFLGWMGFARIVRSQVLTLKERPYVEAARAAGAGTTRIISRHIFPNIVSLTYVNLALAVPAAILTEAALAFLGLSDPSVVSWGNIYQNAELGGALNVVPPPWWWLIPPGVAIALISLSFVLVGFAMDEIFNPRLRRRR
jgi:ABC-type dipeptide/oligopeptide/nickel transport system permease subunit